MSVKTVIESKLQTAFAPIHCVVENESHGHSVGKNAETHFKVVLVSEAFNELKKVMRHQRVYACLSAELEGGVHALALHLYSPEEWALKGEAPASPKCMGGSKK
ncbi:MAG: hypothetical protein RL336_2110 [Pseudomonadota bacterium]